MGKNLHYLRSHAAIKETFSGITNEKGETLELYMKKCKIGENHPGLLIGWNFRIVELFVEEMINLKGRIGTPPAPIWLRMDQDLTPENLMNGIVDYAKASPAGKRSFMHYFIAPNTLSQYFHVAYRMNRIESNPYMQAVMRTICAAQQRDVCLAELAIVTRRDSPYGTPILRVPMDDEGDCNLFH